jgi:hypothetical protein
LQLADLLVMVREEKRREEKRMDGYYVFQLLVFW